MRIQNKYFTWLLIGCILLAFLAAVVLIGLHGGNRDEPALSREQLMRISPATRIEYRQEDKIPSCVIYSDPILNNCITLLDLNRSDEAVNLDQWIFRITYQINSRNIPEIVCLVGDAWVSIEDDVYTFPSQKDAQNFVTFLRDYFHNAVILHGEETQAAGPLYFAEAGSKRTS